MNKAPEQKNIVIEKDGVAHLISMKPNKEKRGFTKDVTTENLRDEEDRI
jgi:hypothetical protein